MELLYRVSIQKRLISALAIWLVILIIFGEIALVKMQELASVTQNIYDHPLQVSNAAKEAHVDIIKMHREMKDLILSENAKEIEEHKNNVDSIEKTVYDQMDIIKNHTVSAEVSGLDQDIRNILAQWKQKRQSVVNLTISGNIKEAAKLSETENSQYVNELEVKLNKIDSLEGIIAKDLINNAHKIEGSEKSILTFSLIILGLIAVIFFTLIIRSIIMPIVELKKVMRNSANTGELLEAKLQGNNELVDMSNSFNALVNRLRDQFWIKDGLNELNQQLSGDYSLNEISQRSINFLGRLLEAGNGVFYLYKEDENYLCLNSSFAFTERDLLANRCKIGEGIVGQVALEGKPILLKNVKKQDAVITTGTICEVPLNVYAFPLIYEKKLYGVIELSSFQTFTPLKQEFLTDCSQIIAINLYSVIQNERIKMLLKDSEESKDKAEKVAEELKKTNNVLEEQQKLLQQQTEELQKTNAELEEQQQLLQQQGAELQQSNAQMEEQQQLLEEQSKVLNIKNGELEASKEKLIERSKQLELTNKYKSEFLANMSHELRTPLNSIILLSKLLLSNKNDELNNDYAEKVSIIYDSGNELLRLINDILDLSKIESGKMNLSSIDFHSKELLADLKLLFKGLSEEKNISFSVEDFVNMELKGDKDKISQILRNLISNALKFTESGSVTLKLEKDNERENGVVFSVVDTGLGIRNEQLSLIFEEFQQGDGSISRKYGGTGLGLSISKKLAELMNGEIKVSSELGLGSNFQILIPNLIKNIDQKNELKNLIAIDNEISEKTIDIEHELKEDESKLLCRTDKEHALNLKGKRILIVDDDPRNIFVLTSALEDFEAEVFNAENGREALEKLNEIEVDLVLMDIMMPIMDGYEAIKIIRENEKLKELPIIALTAKSLKEDRAKCIEIGADDYISKPVDYDVFVRLVKAWIGKKM